MTAALLEIENLYAGYNDVPVVRDLNLHVSPGETALRTWTVRSDSRTTMSSTRSPVRETTWARFPA